MKWGLIARGEDRGLGNMTWEIHRNLHPDRTLLLDLGDLARGFPVHPERYPEAGRLAWTGAPLDAVHEKAVRSWLEGLDVVYSAETYYDWRILDWAREAGVATVLHVMPEFYRCGQDGIPMPDAVWAPTSWRLDELPDATRVVPVPVALDRLAQDRPLNERTDTPLRVLHPAGHRAASDRNGTQIVIRSVQHMTQRIEVTIAGQDGRLPSTSLRRGGPVSVRVAPKGQPNYWQLYRDQDVLVMPRRYGGLCLPVQEGIASGLVPVMPDVAPNGDWPAMLVPCGGNGTIATQGGVLRMVATKPADLARAVDVLARDRGVLATWREAGRLWAHGHSWEALAPLWLDELQRAR